VKAEPEAFVGTTTFTKFCELLSRYGGYTITHGTTRKLLGMSDALKDVQALADAAQEALHLHCGDLLTDKQTRLVCDTNQPFVVRRVVAQHARQQRFMLGGILKLRTCSYPRR